MIKRCVQWMRPGLSACVVASALAGGPAAWAQSSAAPEAVRPGAPAVPPSALSAVQAAAGAPRPAAELRIVEDDQVRIEETRLRGQLQRVTVAPKGSALKSYEINVGAGGRDPSQDKSAAGQRVWSVLRF